MKNLIRFIIASVAAVTAALAQAQPVLKPETIASGLSNPWAVAFIGEGRMLVTERPGTMRVIGSDGKLSAPLQGVPAVAAGGQGGLLDLITDSGFASNRTVYFCFSEAGQGGNSTALARARLSADATRLEDTKIIFSQKPKFSSSLHFGCRIVENPRDNTLWLTLGDRFQRMQDAQTLNNHHGKTIRITKDGAVPPGNPFASTAGALPEIWSYGHRNSQGAVLGPDGRLWMHEHGAQGGDEINPITPGRNYGWPVITYGVNYGGSQIGEGITAKDGMEQPLHHWTPSIAPSGMALLTSDRYGPAWKGSLFVGALRGTALHRLEIQGNKVVREEKPIDSRDRIRDVRQGPDGWLYILTDSSDGKLIRLGL
jgi:aldose sugar dehydrogenase